ncbi:MAG: cell wall hydrolase [Terrisporobacter sp.]|uniref:cell wall hydrolase n=1 Tax=Terrisporobacter sp. TaxID=1965305 RepID=UPI002FC68C44
MDRCYKIIIVSLLVLGNVLISIKPVSAREYYYLDNKTEGCFVQVQDTEKKEAVINLNDDEIMLLSKLIAGEARGESYEGQVAVAAVVINRVKDSRFPDTLEGVIYQKNAFSVVRNGNINVEPTSSTYKAAQDALYGKDPTNDAIYFWNPEISTCSWINTLNPHLRIGNHVFAK